jgi:hypothetical protein
LIFGLSGAFAFAGQEKQLFRSPPKLACLVDIHSVDFHQQKLMSIAERHDNNRAAGTQGYEAAANYIQSLLWMAGYDVEVQEFDFPFFQELSDPLLQQTSPAVDPYLPNDPTGFYTMTYSGSGDVDAPIEAVDLVMPPGAEPNTSTSGCEPADFEGFTAGNIALIQRGSCTFY